MLSRRHARCLALPVVTAIAACGGGGHTMKDGTTIAVTAEEQAERDAAAVAALRATVTLGADTASSTATVALTTTCDAAASEMCNALDDNCNGQVDEGCGYRTGSVQITMAWNTKADMDLYVTDPRGETISNQHRRSASGGEVDQESRGACRPDQKVNEVENAFFTGVPMKGKYTVTAHYWGECGEGGTTTVSISLAVGGKIVGTYNRNLEPGDKSTVFTFELQ